jgi:hypothetical protein
MKPCMKRTSLKQYVGSFYKVPMPIDIPIFVLSPIFWEVDSRLCTQSTEHGYRSGLRFFIFLVPKSKLLSRNEYPPLSADSQKLLISVLTLLVSQSLADTPSPLTGTVFGNSSFVSLLRWLKNWLGVVLHSRLSKWKSSSTWKVNTVFGL